MLDAIRARGVVDAKVLEAMARVPRELFVSRALAVDAYDDITLPIGEQQTISMPSVVGFMTQSLMLTGREKVHLSVKVVRQLTPIMRPEVAEPTCAEVWEYTTK